MYLFSKFQILQTIKFLMLILKSKMTLGEEQLWVKEIITFLY